MSDNIDNNDLNPNEQQNQRSSGKSWNKAKNVENTANRISKNAGKASEALGKRAEKQATKAAMQSGAKAAQTGARAAKTAQHAQKLAQVASKASKVAETAAKLGKIIATVGWVLLIIFIIIGLIVFIIAGLGMIIAGLQEIAGKFLDFLSTKWDGSENNIKPEEIADVAQYLEEMGYDLFGYGFVTKEDAITNVDTVAEERLIEELGEDGYEDLQKKANNGDEEAAETIADKKEEVKDKQGGRERVLKYELSEDDPYKYLKAYLVSDNYAYLVKNHNQNLMTAWDNGFFDNINNPVGWGSGLISIYRQEDDDGKTVTGKPGDAYGFSGKDVAVGATAAIMIYAGGPVIKTLGAILAIGEAIANWDDITSSIEVEEKDGKFQLEVVGPGLFNSTKLTYSLDGWTGRYSMPLEFLLATHIATMAPDLSYKLATSFNTDLEMIICETSVDEIDAAIVPPGADASDRIYRSTFKKIFNEDSLFDWDWWQSFTFDSERAYLVLHPDEESLKNQGISDEQIDALKGLKSISEEGSKYKCTGPPDKVETKSSTFDGYVGSNLNEVSKEDKANVLSEYDKLIEEVKKDEKIEISNSEEFYSNVRKDIEKEFWTQDNQNTDNDGNTKKENSIKYISATLTRDASTDATVPRFKTYLTFSDDKYKNKETNTGEYEIVVDYSKEDWVYDYDPDKITEFAEEKIKSKIKNITNLEVISLKKADDSNLKWPDDLLGTGEYPTIKIGLKSKEEEQSNDSTNNSELLLPTESLSYVTGTAVDGKYDGEDVKYQVEVSVTSYVGEKGRKTTSNSDYPVPYWIWTINLLRITPDASNILCSDKKNTTEQVCENCKKYVEDIFDAMNDIQVDDVTTYFPYINKVTNHWFRNVYFTPYALSHTDLDGDGTDDTVNVLQTDDQYEKETGERWTAYQMDVENKDYEIFVYFPKGEYDYEIDLRKEGENYVVCKKGKGTKQYKLEENGVQYVQDDKGEYTLQILNGTTYSEYSGDWPSKFRGGKRALVNSEITASNWSGAYNKEIQKSDSVWEDITTDGNVDEINNLIDNGVRLQYKKDMGVVKQVEDGVRGETNAEVKKIFLDDYYKYDGSTKTALLIQKAKDIVSEHSGDMYVEDSDAAVTYNANYLDPDNPDSYKQLLELGKVNEKIVVEVEGEEPYEATIDQISGPISLKHNALSAFSILENMHTLDAEYIYRDFKELIVELDYFDKEDLVDAEDTVMMFPVAGVSAGGWPDVRYDKSEEFYGTLIHSAQDYEALRAETEAELQKIIDTENGAPEDEGEVESKIITDSTTVTPADGAGDTSYADSTTLTDSQKMILQAAEDLHYYLETHGYDYSLKEGDVKSTLQESIDTDKKYVCCGTFIGWTAQALGLDFTMSHGSKTVNENILTANEKVEKIEVNGLDDFKNKLQPGDIVWRPRDGGQGHTQIFVGFDDNGQFLWYNCGSSDSVKKAEPYQSDYEISKYKYIYRWTGCDLTYNGMKVTGKTATSGAEYAGYEGGEDVLSPVTGEVLKYGIIERDDIQKGNTSTEENSEENTQQNVDKYVGFIKIKLVDQGLPGSNDGCTYFAGTKKGIDDASVEKYDKNELKADEWLKSTYVEETLKKLGYDYFWEEYNNAGLTGYILYIEGFDVSGILGDDIDENANANENIKKLKEHIEKIDTQNSYNTEYSVPNLLDETREFELQVAEAAKKMAAFTFESPDGKIFIKEGAVIGKTYTQDELKAKGLTEEKTIEMVQTESDENTDNTENTTEPTATTTTVQVGNYLRIILRDTGDEILENVEDYVETGSGAGSKEGVFGELEEITQDSSYAEKIRAAVTYFLSEGFTVEGACGILGNIIQESTLNPGANLDNDKKYKGLVQWDKGGRWDNVTTWMRQNGYNNDDFAGQIRAIYECESGQMSVDLWEELKTADNVEKAAELFCVYFERGVGGEDEPQWYKTGNKYQELIERKQWSHNAYDIYMGDDTKGVKDK